MKCELDFRSDKLQKIFVLSNCMELFLPDYLHRKNIGSQANYRALAMFPIKLYPPQKFIANIFSFFTFKYHVKKCSQWKYWIHVGKYSKNEYDYIRYKRNQMQKLHLIIEPTIRIRINFTLFFRICYTYMKIQKYSNF